MNLFQGLFSTHTPADHFGAESTTRQREMILQRVLNFYLVAASIGLPVMLIFYPQAFRSGNAGIFIGSFLALAAVTLIPNIPYPIRAAAGILTLLGAGGISLINGGLSGTAVLFLFGSVIIASMLFGVRIGRIVATISLLFLALTGTLMTTGIIPAPAAETTANSASTGQWMMTGFVFFLLISITAGPIFSLRASKGGSPSRPGATAQAAELEQESLERLVEERTTKIKEKARQYETASQITRAVSAAAGPENILRTAVDLIYEGFGFYYVGILINDRKNEYAVLRAAAGEVGQKMLEQGYQMMTGETGFVGDGPNHDEAQLPYSTDNSSLRARNPFLPDSRSVAALPLRTSSRSIGLLEIHSVVENAFRSDDLSILQTIADQVANAFEKAQQLDETKRALAELETSYSSATQKAWSAHLRNTRQKLAYRYHAGKLEPVSAQASFRGGGMDDDISSIQVLKLSDNGGDAPAVLAVPIKIRNQVLGVVELQFEGATVLPGMIELIQGSVDRLAVSLENARLMEEIQIRAERERMVGDISAKVRAASDVDSVLRIAVQEIGKTLGVSEVMLQLRKGA